MIRTIELEFITPLFSHGATDVPEMRPASIRGQLHSWFRILGGDIEAERRVFGGIRNKKADSKLMPSHDKTAASKVVVRVCNVTGAMRELPTLPHKQDSRGGARGGMSALRKAFDAGSKCRVVVTDRLGGLGDDDALLLNRAIDAWLLMGTLGFRATRAAGSFAWKDEVLPMPADPLSYQDACRNLLDDASAEAKVAVLGKEYSSAETARRDVSDSLGGKDDRRGQDELASLHDPLGKIRPGRKTSPLKYRIVRFGDSYRILAFWDGRRNVTGNTDDDFYGVIELLKKKGKRIGDQLAEAFGC